MKKILMTSSLFIMLAGCGVNNDIAYDEPEGRYGQGILSTQNVRSDQDAGIDRITYEQNPNLLNVTQTQTSQGSVIEKVREVIRNQTNYRPGPISINGNDMWITVYKKGMLNQQEKIELEAQLHKILIRTFPRYDIEVNVQEDRT